MSEQSLVTEEGRGTARLPLVDVCVCVIYRAGRDIYGGGVTTTTTTLPLVPLRFGRPLLRGGYIIINNTTAPPTRQPLPTPSRRLLMTTYM